MSRDVKLPNNYALTPVPEDQAVSGLRIALIVIGVTIAMPAFVVGSQIMAALGFQRGLLAIFLGGAILAVVGGLTMGSAAYFRLSTYALVRQTFGRHGAKLVNLILSATVLGWYGVIAQLFGRTLNIQFESFGWSAPEWPFTVFGSILMIVTAVYGFKAIDRLSAVAVPLLLAVLIWGVAAAIQDTSFAAIWSLQAVPSDSVPSIGVGISIVAGGMMVGATIAPDLGRFARGLKASSFAALLSYAIGFPVVLVLSGLPSVVTGNADFVDNLLAIGQLPMMFMLIFAAWTTNVNNLYSGSLALAQLAPRLAGWKLTLIGGVGGTILALLEIADRVVPFILTLSVLIPPIAGIYVVNCWERRSACAGNQGSVRTESAVCGVAFVSWIGASGIAWILGTTGYSISGISALDSVILAAFLYGGLHRATVYYRRSAALVIPSDDS